MHNIALIAPSYLPSRRANTIQVMKMAQAFIQDGNRVHVYVPRRRMAHWSEPAWLDLAHHYGIREHFPVTWVPVQPAWRGYDFAVKALARARRWGAGIIYTRHPQAAALASRLRRPAVLEIHDFPQGRTGPWLFRQFLGGPGARRLIAISHALENDLQSSFRIPAGFSLVAPDGVDLERYRDLPDPTAARAALSLAEGFTAGYTGSLYPGRGVELILALAARLPEVHFLLAGGSDADVERVRTHAGGAGNLTFTGFVPNAELPRIQAACDILLMPYQSKVAASSGGDIAPYLSPMKLFEYLAGGRAILSSDLPVLREVLDETCAVLLPPDDVGAWVEALRRLAAQEEEVRRLGAAARTAAEKYSWQERAHRLLSGLV